MTFMASILLMDIAFLRRECLKIDTTADSIDEALLDADLILATNLYFLRSTSCIIQTRSSTLQNDMMAA